MLTPWSEQNSTAFQPTYFLKRVLKIPVSRCFARPSRHAKSRSDSACWLPDHIKPQSGRAFSTKDYQHTSGTLTFFCGKGFYGMKVHEAVYESGVKYTGCTVHFVDAGVDAGPIILQEVVRVEDDDTPDTIAEKVLQLEHRVLPTVIKLISEGRVMVNGRASLHTTGVKWRFGRKKRGVTVVQKRKALISVSRKEGVVELAKELKELGFEIISTGGTYNLLKESGVEAVQVSDITGFPEILDGRGKNPSSICSCRHFSK